MATITKPSFSKPPLSVKDLIEKIQYIINNYDKVAFMTASKLGEAVGVSESTVVRFANALGYAGYPKLQEGLQELIKNKLTTVQRVEMANEDYSDDSTILSKVLKSDSYSPPDLKQFL